MTSHASSWHCMGAWTNITMAMDIICWVLQCFATPYGTMAGWPSWLMCWTRRHHVARVRTPGNVNTLTN